jgi:hypothetical protein
MSVTSLVLALHAKMRAMRGRRLRRYVALAAALLALLFVVDRVRDDGTRAIATSPPPLNTATSPYVPAVVRGDPLPTISNPDDLRVSRAGSTVQGLALTAPGAKADDNILVILFAPDARMTLERTDGIKLYDPHAPSWFAMAGSVTAINGALAAMRYEPTRAGTQQLYVQLTNRTLGTNPRKVTVAIQVT